MTHASKHRIINYWIVDRRFVNLKSELTRILQPLQQVQVIVDRRLQDRLPEWAVFSQSLGAWSLSEDRRKEQGWIVDRRFADLAPQLSKVLLQGIRTIIDRRARGRRPGWTVYSEALGAWPLVEKRGNKQYWIVARRFADLETELTRILQPLPEVEVIIDRRAQGRPA